MIRGLSILILALVLSTQGHVNAADDDLSSSSSSSSKKRKLQEKAKPEKKEVAKSEVSIDLQPLFRKDVIVELNLSNNGYLTDINFLLAFPTLTSLILMNCTNLNDNYQPISQLTNLKSLDIRGINLT